MTELARRTYDNTLMPTHVREPADLRGLWKLSDRSDVRVEINNPTDLVKNGYWPSTVDIEHTWGQAGLIEFNWAVANKEAVRAGEILFDSGWKQAGKITEE